MVSAIPENYPRMSPYLSVDGAGEAIEFYVDVLGANVRGRMDGPDGKVGHAELEIGDSVLMLADIFPEANQSSPKDLGGTPVMMMVYVEDADATHAKALAAGATELSPVEDQFYGDRSGRFVDPWDGRDGHHRRAPPRVSAMS